MTEQWLPIVGWEGFYEISDRGQIKSLARTVESVDGVRKPIRPRTLTLFPDKGGYPKVRLSRNGASYNYPVHRLLLRTFVGEPPFGMVALHKNGNPADCRIDNLRWGTHAENAQDRLRHGKDHSSNKTHCPQGHPYDEANTYVDVYGRRQCRLCIARRKREQRERKLLNIAPRRPGRPRRPSTE